MQRIHGTENDGGGTGAGERGGNFLAHVAGLADADHDDLAALRDRARDQRDRLFKRAVELGTHGFERGDLDVEDFPGAGEMIHHERGCQCQKGDSTANAARALR